MSKEIKLSEIFKEKITEENRLYENNIHSGVNWALDTITPQVAHAFASFTAGNGWYYHKHTEKWVEGKTNKHLTYQELFQEFLKQYKPTI